MLLDKKPIVSDMKWVDWKYIDANEDHFPHVHEDFRSIDLDEFIGKKLTSRNDEMIMQFYSTAHFYPNGRIVWMTDGVRYQSSVQEWATLLGVPKAEENDIDVYAKSKMDHNSMANQYTEIPDQEKENHKLGSVYYLLAGLATSNTIMRHTMMPKSGDERMIRGHSINMLHHIDCSERFRLMDLIVETITKTAADQKRPCGFAPHIQVLINSKVGNKTYLLDREHLPLRPEFQDNTVTMDPSHPTSATAQAKKEARA